MTPYELGRAAAELGNPRVSGPSGAMRFADFYDARDYASKWCARYPGWRITDMGGEFAIELNPATNTFLPSESWLRGYDEAVREAQS